MPSRALLVLLGSVLSVAACATAPIGTAHGDGTDTGATASNSTGATKRDSASTLDVPVAASTTSCTNLKACAARISGADAITFAKVAGEGDASTCTKALSQCTTELGTAKADAGAAPTTTPTTPATPATVGCTDLTTCCDTLFSANNSDYQTCDKVAANGVDSSCAVSLGAFQDEGTCL